MTYISYINEARHTFRENFNDYLESLGLEPMQAYVDAFTEVRRMERSIAVYPSLVESTYRETETTAETSFTVCLYNNEDASVESMNETILYFSALLAFIGQYRFGEYDNIADSHLSLMDGGEEANGCFVHVESRIATKTDSDIYGDFDYV